MAGARVRLNLPSCHSEQITQRLSWWGWGARARGAWESSFGALAAPLPPCSPDTDLAVTLTSHNTLCGVSPPGLYVSLSIKGRGEFSIPLAHWLKTRKELRYHSPMAGAAFWYLVAFGQLPKLPYRSL